MQPSQLKAALAVQAPASGGTAQPQGDNTDEARLSAVMLHRKSCIIVADAGSADVDPLLGSARLPQEVPFLVRLACASTLHSVSALLVDGEHVVDLVLCHQAQQCGVQSAAAAANLARFHYSTWKHAAAQQPATNMEQALAFISAAQRITSSLQQPACQQHTVLQLHIQGSGDAKPCQRTITVLGVSGCSAASVCSRVAQLMLMPMAGGAPPTLTRPAGVAAPAWAILAPYIRACTVVMTLPDAGTTVLGGPHSHPVTEAPPEDVEPPVLHEEQALLRELVQQQQELVQAQSARITTLEQDRANLQEQMAQLKAQLLASPGDVPLALTSSASLAADDASTGSGHGSHNSGSNVITSIGIGNGSNNSGSNVNASTGSGTGLTTASSTPNTWRPTDFLRSMTLTSLNGSSDARSLPLTSPCGTKPLGTAELPMPRSLSWFGQEPAGAGAAQHSLTSPGAPGLAPAAQHSKVGEADTLQPSRSVPAEKPSSRAAPLKASQSLGKRPPRPAGPLKASHSLGESGSIARSLQALLPGPSLRRANTSVASSAASSAAADMAAASSTLVSSASLPSLPVGTQPSGDLAEQLRVCRLELGATKQQVELLATKLTQKVERSPGVDIKLMQEVAALREECAAGSAQLAAARAQVLALNAQVHEQAALIAKLQAHSSRDSSPSTPSSGRHRGSPRSQSSSAPSSPSLPSSAGRGRAQSHSSSRGSDTGSSSSGSSGGARHGRGGSRQSPHGSFTGHGQRACGTSIKSWPLHVVTYRLAADAAVRAAAQTLWARSASRCRAKPIASFPLRDPTISSFRLHDHIISAAEEEAAMHGDRAKGSAPAAGSAVAELAQAMPAFEIVWEATPSAAAVTGAAAVSARSGAATTNVLSARLGSQAGHASLQSADSMHSAASVLSGTSSASLSTVRSGSVSSTSSHARSSGRRSTSLPAGLPPACSLRLGSKPLSLPLGSHPLQATPRAGAPAGKQHLAAQAEQGLPWVHTVRCPGPRTVRTFALRSLAGAELSSDEAGSEPDSGASERDVSDEACDMELQRSSLKRPRLTCS